VSRPCPAGRAAQAAAFPALIRAAGLAIGAAGAAGWALPAVRAGVPASGCAGCCRLRLRLGTRDPVANPRSVLQSVSSSRTGGLRFRVGAGASFRASSRAATAGAAGTAADRSLTGGWGRSAGGRRVVLRLTASAQVCTYGRPSHLCGISGTSGISRRVRGTVNLMSNARQRRWLLGCCARQ